MKRLVLVAVLPHPAAANPLRLRADALATTSSPAGLVTVEADGAVGSTASAETVVWMGSGDSDHADVLVMALRARTPDGRLGVRVGRFVESLGALRPVQVDGAAARVVAPYGLVAEAYAGSPVMLPGTSRAWDWIAGGRVAEQIGDGGSIGLAYVQERDDGRLASEEVGVDGGAALGRRDDLGAKLVYDLANPGLAEASLTASHRFQTVRVELFSSYRAASHLLPATSLFSVLGDEPAERLGTTITWKAAPRLDLGGDLGVRYADGDAAPELVARAKLRLDDRGTSALTAELRRDGVGADQWTGARGSARIALPRALSVSTELELVIPDHGIGTVWPWALIALAYDDGTWSAAIAGEADASPEDRHRVDVLVQLGRRWGTR